MTMLLAALFALQPSSCPAPDEPWVPYDPAVVLARCADDLRDPQPKPSEDRRTDCWIAAKHLLEASPGEEARVWSLLDAVPPADPIRDGLLESLLESRLRRALEVLPSPAVAPDASKLRLRTPGQWRAEIAAARAEYARLTHLYETVVTVPEEQKIAYQQHQAEFDAIIDDYLRGRLPALDMLPRLARFRWGGWCGTGAEMLVRKQSMAVELALLDLRDYERAAAAALQRLDGTGMFDRQHDEGLRIFAAAGMDWEAAYVGAVLAGKTGAMQDLGGRGSSHAARLLLAARDMPSAPGENSRTLMETAEFVLALAAFVPPGDRCSDDARGDVLLSFQTERAGDAVAVVPEVQREILDALAQSVRPDAGLEEAEHASAAIERLCRIESRSALRTMLRSAYSAVRERGFRVLRAFGDEVAEPPASSPVAFAVLVDGKPARNLVVGWGLSRREGTTETGLKTDDKGRLVTDRDPFLDTRHPIQHVWIRAYPDDESLEDPYFEVTLPVPCDLSTETTVRVVTQSLTVTCDGAPRNGAQMQLWIDGVAMSLKRPFMRPSTSWPRLQRGHRYTVVLTAEGWRRQSPPLPLDDTPVLFDCGDALDDHRQ